jgi:PadR family transcriptional regulator, regulatory protein PadR
MRMNGSGEFIRGFTEYIILSILEKFDSYGYEMTKIIEQASQKVFSLTEAALYLALKRMTEDELISSALVKNKKGMNRRVYTITPKGTDVLTAFRRDWTSIHMNLQTLVAGEFTYERDE